MHNRPSLISLTCALAAGTLLAACSSAPKPLYTQEQFDASSSPYTHTFHESSTATCEAARRALLSQGYITNLARPDTVDGSKNFQPNNDTHVVIEFHVVCVDADADSSSSIAYVNAVQDRYTLKKTNTSASVGLSVLGSVSLPIGSSDDSMVKIASETIPAGVFYDRFFKLVDHFLKVDPARHGKAAAKAAEKEPVAPLPEPAPSTGTPGDDGSVKLKTPAVPTPPSPPISGLAPVPVAATGAAALATVAPGAAQAHAVTAPGAAMPAAPVAPVASQAPAGSPSPAPAPAPASSAAEPAAVPHQAAAAGANLAPVPATAAANGNQAVVPSTGTSAVENGGAAQAAAAFTPGINASAAAQVAPAAPGLVNVTPGAAPATPNPAPAAPASASAPAATPNAAAPSAPAASPAVPASMSSAVQAAAPAASAPAASTPTTSAPAAASAATPNP
ncbi:DUF2242 domain-containing protein [Burkholderia gladioli]|uniref:DUF2242 domain-containing protein n=3 Tax=Burkholderia gladioli TaxID=28095 RepID=F2L852_BURGS|nr:DUF2242 domain-containing protein [Burkholderia gladioli]AEA59983.1 hypothetical protein bgla_1g13090 [Burkholderia gladioli BSR3]MBW5286066.1 DUF2242 domain-containing protein [Burkholderia gladioli]